MSESPSRYRLVRVVASGGMAQVYEAVLVGAGGFERRVAIKRVLPQHAQDPSMHRMFLDEARLVARLNHGNIVQVFDFGFIDGTEFIAMEYVDGADAWRAAQRGVAAGAPMPEVVALHIVTAVAHALSYAHSLRDEQGRALEVVHRDVSPQNALLSWEGDVKLSDFGIALTRQREERTRTGLVKGKEGYIAPELALGEKASPAADVYGLGATLHALLAGAPPPSPGELELADEGPAELVALLRRWLDVDAAARPTAEQAAAEAGSLAARLGASSDPRSELRRWLAPLRPGLERRSALDALVGVSLLHVGGQHFTVEGATRATVPQRRPGQATIRRRARAGLLVGGVVLLSGLGGALYLLRQPTSGPEARTDGRTTAADASRVVEGSPARRDAAAARDLAADRGAAEGPRRWYRPKVRPPPRPASQPSKAPVVSRELGWLRVGGARLARRQVAIDGKDAGYAPFERSLAVGSHKVVVRDPATAAVVLERVVTVEPHHTRVQPLRLIW